MNNYMPVTHEFQQLLFQKHRDDETIKITYFVADEEVTSSQSAIFDIESSEQKEYLYLKNGDKVRLDRIVTVNGRPGPAFDEYDAFANACLDCGGEI